MILDALKNLASVPPDNTFTSLLDSTYLRFLSAVDKSGTDVLFGLRNVAFPVSGAILRHRNTHSILIGKRYQYILWYLGYPSCKNIIKQKDKTKSLVWKCLTDRNIEPFYPYAFLYNQDSKLVDETTPFIIEGGVDVKISLTIGENVSVYLSFPFPTPDVMESGVLVGEAVGGLKTPIYYNTEVDSLPPQVKPEDVVSDTTVKKDNLVVWSGVNKMQPNTTVAPRQKRSIQNPFFADVKYQLTPLTKLKYPGIGEFIGLAVRPMSGRGYSHWRQKSVPFIHSGVWFTLKNYTSGIITKIISNDYYEVLVEDRILRLYSIDFFRYKVNDRVAIVKNWKNTFAKHRVWVDWGNEAKTSLDTPVLDSNSIFKWKEWKIAPLSVYNIN